jgi:zinc-finger binding domain of transposase IS66
MAMLGEDVTEVLDYVPGRFQVIRQVRPKYACNACEAVAEALSLPGEFSTGTCRTPPRGGLV